LRKFHVHSCLHVCMLSVLALYDTHTIVCSCACTGFTCIRWFEVAVHDCLAGIDSRRFGSWEEVHLEQLYRSDICLMVANMQSK
jgi:hypothetical protein